MDIATTPPPVFAGAQSTLPEKNGTTLNSDFETFLKMLTAQMQYQDPLNPVDSSEYASQLAQFSSVEQQVLTNDLLTGLGAQLGVMGLSQMAGWVGMEARSFSPAYFDGSPIEVTPSIASRADAAFLVTRDASGKEVDRQQIPVDTSKHFWSGLDSDGAVLPFGTYSFDVESMVKGEVIDVTAAQTYGRITEARAEAGTTKLMLAGGALIAVDQVTAIRE